jgi:hypothetical protein
VPIDEEISRTLDRVERNGLAYIGMTGAQVEVLIEEAARARGLDVDVERADDVGFIVLRRPVSSENDPQPPASN